MGYPPPPFLFLIFHSWCTRMPSISVSGVLDMEVIPEARKSVLRGLGSPDQHTCFLVTIVDTREGAGEHSHEGTK